MKSLRKILFVLAMSLGMVMASPAAQAGDPQIDAAIAAGEVGERIDGYLGVVGTADPAITRKVNEVNNRRRALYDRLARETGTTPAQVARVTGEKQIAKLRSGQYYMDASGSWKKK